MKRAIAVLVILLFLMSCTAPKPASTDKVSGQDSDADQLQQKVEEVQEQATQVEKKEQQDAEKKASVVVEETKQAEPPKEVPPSPVEVKVVESTEISDQVKELLAKADSKIKSYSYTLAPPPDQLARDQWFVKGTKIMIELYSDNYVEPDTYYDTIFIDTETKKADGYCLNQRTTRCAEPGQHFNLDYDAVYHKTPYQWLKEIKGVPKIVSSEVVYDRRVSVVEYTDGKDTIKQWIDQFSGLPIRIEMNGIRTSQWEFRYLAINNVLDSDIKTP